jgi:S-adenosylmethionine synthetase
MRLARALSPGHPDRACDIIAETIVDEYLRRDPESRLRIHVAGGKGALFLTGVAMSKADFDVGAIAVRAAASLGVRNPIEPFVAMETVSGIELPSALRLTRPIMVAGYAAVETPERVPVTVALARRVVKHLEMLRTSDPDWFWLEPGFEVSIASRAPGEKRVFVSCAHGTKELTEVREAIRAALVSFCNTSDIRVNQDGPLEAWGLDSDIGASAKPDEPYGSGLPIVATIAGIDPFHPRKFGVWLARGVARDALARAGSKAVLVQAVYEPGDDAPTHLRIRDERGRDVSEADDLVRMSCAALGERLRPGLSVDAMRYGFAGEESLPWES